MRGDKSWSLGDPPGVVWQESSLPSSMKARVLCCLCSWPCIVTHGLSCPSSPVQELPTGARAVKGSALSAARHPTAWRRSLSPSPVPRAWTSMVSPVRKGKPGATCYHCCTYMKGSLHTLTFSLGVWNDNPETHVLIKLKPHFILKLKGFSVLNEMFFM